MEESLTKALIYPIKVRTVALVSLRVRLLPTENGLWRHLSSSLRKLRSFVVAWMDRSGCQSVKSVGVSAPVNQEPVSQSEIAPDETKAERLRRTAKASKSDDAGVPACLWNDRVKLALKARHLSQDEFLLALWVIRKGSLAFWKSSVVVNFTDWWKEEVRTARRQGKPTPM